MLGSGQLFGLRLAAFVTKEEVERNIEACTIPGCPSLVFLYLLFTPQIPGNRRKGVG